MTKWMRVGMGWNMECHNPTYCPFITVVTSVHCNMEQARQRRVGLLGHVSVVEPCHYPPCVIFWGGGLVLYESLPTTESSFIVICGMSTLEGGTSTT